MWWLVLLFAAEELEDFHTGLFQTNHAPGLFQVNTGLEGSHILAAFGYFNSDKQQILHSCDLAVISSSFSEVQIFTWDQSSFSFQPSKLKISVQGTILGVQTGDIDFNGSLDLIVSWTDNTYTYTQLFLQKNKKFQVSEREEIQDWAQPAVFDIDRDLKLDLLVNINYGNYTSLSILTYEQDKLTKEEFSQYAKVSSKCLQENDLKLSTPHSSAFVDLNKDCLADIFLTTVDETGVYFEVWLNNNDGYYCQVLKELAPQGAGMVSFSDVDKNGLQDLIFPVFSQESDSIHIVYNDNDVSTTCTFDSSKISNKKFSLEDLSSTKATQNKEILKIGKLKTSEKFPNILRFGDIDLDGYPDMLVNIEQNGISYIHVYQNDEGTFKKSKQKQYDKLHSIQNAFIGCFFDLDENGVIDILVVSQQNSSYKISSFYNNFLLDAFHLKALALNGYQRQEYSSSYPGAVFMFTITELDMKKRTFHSTQSPSTAYFALNTPYCVFGIGRTNSYIEEFYVALPYKDNNFMVWTPIIPNSYVIASPDTESQLEWFLELFASPTDQIGVIIAVAIGGLVLLSLVATWKYFRERKEDKERGKIQL